MQCRTGSHLKRAVDPAEFAVAAAIGALGRLRRQPQRRARPGAGSQRQPVATGHAAGGVDADRLQHCARPRKQRLHRAGLAQPVDHAAPAMAFRRQHDLPARPGLGVKRLKRLGYRGMQGDGLAPLG